MYTDYKRSGAHLPKIYLSFNWARNLTTKNRLSNLEKKTKKDKQDAINLDNLGRCGGCLGEQFLSFY
jgi:hypothetical protein